jgi:hypothetical protein
VPEEETEESPRDDEVGVISSRGELGSGAEAVAVDAAGAMVEDKEVGIGRLDGRDGGGMEDEDEDEDWETDKS